MRGLLFVTHLHRPVIPNIVVSRLFPLALHLLVLLGYCLSRSLLLLEELLLQEQPGADGLPLSPQVPHLCAQRGQQFLQLLLGCGGAAGVPLLDALDHRLDVLHSDDLLQPDVLVQGHLIHQQRPLLTPVRVEAQQCIQIDSLTSAVQQLPVDPSHGLLLLSFLPLLCEVVLLSILFRPLVGLLLRVLQALHIHRQSIQSIEFSQSRVQVFTFHLILHQFFQVIIFRSIVIRL
mmetsp:Transcript_22428/g.30711  ORF Transcript_22428/g.30711 Transcript_22428/m.30711 type:complete len:233 (-) Transcript_22428:168-866(-)